MSYWTSTNVDPIGETQVSITAENGLNYEVGNTQRQINLFIPPSVKFLSGKDSYLQFNMKINQPANISTRLQLDPAGAGMIVRNLRIYDGSRGNLIEEINEYNQLVALDHDYNSDTSSRNLVALEQGGVAYSERCKGTQGTSQSEYANVVTNPWFKYYSGAAALTDIYDPDVQNNTVKCCVPLKMSGVFSGAIFPNMMTNGLYVELDLMPAPRIVKQLDSVVRSRRTPLCPKFKSLDGSAADDWAVNATVVTFFHLLKENSMRTIGDVPFVVGETVLFQKTDSATHVVGTDVSDMSAAMVISAIEDAGADGIKITIAPGVSNNGPGGAGGLEIDQTFSLVSAELLGSDVVSAAGVPLSYTISDFQFIAHQIEFDASYEARMMAKARAGKFIEFDIYSATNYKNSMLASERQATFLIHANNQKAKSVVCIPTDSSVYKNGDIMSSDTSYQVTQDEMDTQLRSARPGISGCCDFLSSYQMQIDGKLVPSRPVSTKKIATRESIDAFHIFELEKGLSSSKIPAKSLAKYMDNFVITRGFGGSSDGAMDLRGKDLSLILDYSESTAPTKPKMFNTFVFHVRRVRIRGGMAEVHH